MKAIKYMWRYLKNYKKLVALSLLMLIFNQVLGLLSPLIVKEILDEHLNGIEHPWYEVADKEEGSVYFNGKYYLQEKNFDGKPSGNQVTIIMDGGDYYFLDEPILDGQQTIEGSKLIVDHNGETIVYEGIVALTYQDVVDFYTPSLSILTILLILLFVRSILSIIVGYVQRITSANININLTRDARLDAAKKLEKLPISYFESEPAGKLANRIIFDVNGIAGTFGTMMNLVVNASLSLVFAYIGMFILDPKLATITFIAYPIIYLWARFFIKKLNRIAKKVSELNSQIAAFLNETINGISILQVFNYGRPTRKRFSTLNQEFMDEQMREVKLHMTLGWSMIDFLRSLITAVIVLYFGMKSFTIGDLVITAGLIYAYNEYLLKVIDPISIIFRNVGNLEHAFVRTERFFKLLDAEDEEDTFETIPRYKGSIVFDNVNYGYTPEKQVLKGINLAINPGEMVGIVGHTGSGKSTLMSLLMRFYDLKPTDSGKILVDGEDINSLSKRTYRQHISIILQDPILFKGTVATNVRFGKENITDEEIERTLIRIGGENLLKKFDKGIHQEISRGGANLSVGEKQLICFARAIINDPAILIMDEATANIDTETEEMIQRALQVAAKGRTVIIIAHRLSTIKNADKIIVLNNGKKFEEGSHEELLINNGIYANIYRSQVPLATNV